MKKVLLTSLKIYVSTWLIMIGWFVIRGFSDKITIKASLHQFIELLSFKQFLIFIHGAFVFFYVLFLIIRYFIRVYKKKGKKIMLKQLGIRLVLPIVIVVFGFNFVIDINTRDTYNYIWNSSFENKASIATSYFENDEKHRGMSVFGWHDPNEKAIDNLVKNNIEWVAVIPFFHQKDEHAFVIESDITIAKWRRRDSTFINTIDELKKKGIKVMLKPHLWLFSGWRSDLSFDTDEQWNIWFESYRTIMIHYATMAKITDVELLCIGTELRTSIKKQPEKWKQLISEIKAIYKGKLTYAANWYDEYEHISFWDELDFIGIQAYFPLTDHKNPELDAIKQGWKPHKEKLKVLSDLYKKPILFTEIGYRSDASSTIKPWEWNSLANISTNQRSTKTQQLAYEAMFESFWNEPWFKGTYIWQWDTRTKKERALESFDFSPRFKPAENTIAKWYGNYNSLQK